MKFVAPVVFTALLTLATTANAGVVLSDNFNSDPLVLNWAGDGVFASTAPPGSTDLIGFGFYDLQPGHGNYVDLDGTTGEGNDPAGELTSISTFGPGTYTLSFLLAGNLRGYFAQTTDVYLGGQLIASLTPANDAGFALFTYTVTTAVAGNLVFTERGPSDQQGNLLDDVTLSVPEPSVLALIGMALLSLIGFGAMRRRADA